MTLVTYASLPDTKQWKLPKTGMDYF